MTTQLTDFREACRLKRRQLDELREQEKCVELDDPAEVDGVDGGDEPHADA